MLNEDRQRVYLRDRKTYTPKQVRRLNKKYWQGKFIDDDDYVPCPSCGGPYDHSEAACQGDYEENWS